MRLAIVTLLLACAACGAKAAQSPPPVSIEVAPAGDDVDPNGVKIRHAPPPKPPPSDETASADKVPSWLYGDWGVDCTQDTPSFTFIRLGPNRARQKHANGNAYDFDVTIDGDVVEMQGEYESAPMTIKWRIVNRTTLHYFFHYFSGKQWPADGTYRKCE